MQFFFSGELDIDIADSYREVRKIVEDTLNENLGEKYYGDVLETIGIIPLILGPRFIKGKKSVAILAKQKYAPLLPAGELSAIALK